MQAITVHSFSLVKDKLVALFKKPLNMARTKISVRSLFRSLMIIPSVLLLQSMYKYALHKLFVT